MTTAGRLFYDAGVTATGVDAVARAAGLSKPTLYAHFRSKDELVTAVLEQRHAERAGELQAWVDRVADPGERPLAVFAWLADWYARDGARGCAFLNAAAELPDPAGPARLAIGREKRWLADLLARLVQEAGLPDPDRLASQLLLLIDGVAARVLVHGAGAAAQAVADASAVAVLLVSTAARAAS